MNPLNTGDITRMHSVYQAFPQGREAWGLGPSFQGSSHTPMLKPHSQAQVSSPGPSLILRLKSHSQAQSSFQGSSLIPRLKPHFQAQVSFPRLNLGMRLGTLLMMVSRSMKNGVASSPDPFPLLRRGSVHTVRVLYIPSFREFVK